MVLVHEVNIDGSATGRIPQSRAGLASSDNFDAIRTEGHRLHWPFMLERWRQRLTGRSIPKASCAILASGHDFFTIGTKGCGKHTSYVLKRPAERLAGP